MKRSELEQWLDYLSHITGEDLKRSVMNDLQAKKELNCVQMEETPLCRHCLLEIGILMSTNKESEKKIKEILKEYDFNGAIIC
jgi:hypothetical protein